MFKKYFISICFIALAGFAFAQDTKHDTIPATRDGGLGIDTSMNYDDLLSDFDVFLDSILAPRSYFLTDLSVAQGYFNFTNRRNTKVSLVRRNVWSPTIGYYAKSGLGISVTGYVVNDSVHSNLYQVSLAPSFDYLKNRDLAIGISYQRYFTKDSLPFYTSPLQNEMNGYFLWRKSWLKPGITASYGWGSHTEYKKREVIYKRLVETAAANGTIRLIDTILILTKNKESIVDFSLAGSLRHDFYWLNIFSQKDYIRFTPVVSVSAGTQKFGFNQTNGISGGIYAVNRLNADYANRNISLEQKFRILSMSLYLRGDYSLGKFFFQPQLLLDYYFPAKDNNFAALFSINAGFMF
jgi:hypothetical protein